MLYDKFEDISIVDSLGNKVGTIKDIYIDLDSWNIVALRVSPGTLKKSFLLKIDDIEKLDLEEMNALVKEGWETGELPDTPVKSMFPYHELRSKKIVDKHDEKVGKIYDIEIPFEKLGEYRVWKLLIKVGLKERRLRIAPTDVEDVKEDINLSKSLEEYKPEME